MADYQRTSWLISSLASSPATVAAADAAGASASMSRRQASAQGENERTSHLNPGFELGCASAGEGTRERGGQANWLLASELGPTESSPSHWCSPSMR